jgi:hypothetical protein
MIENEPMNISTPRQEVGLRQVDAEEEDQHDDHDGGVDEAVDDGEDGRAQQLRHAPHGGHHGVLERALPALPADLLGDDREDDRQVVPEGGADHQRQDQPLAVLVTPDERDGQRTGDGVDHEGHFPAPVALGQVEVALDEGVARPQFAR